MVSQPCIEMRPTAHCAMGCRRTSLNGCMACSRSGANAGAIVLLMVLNVRMLAAKGGNGSDVENPFDDVICCDMFENGI